MATNLQEIIPALFVGKSGQLLTPEEIARQREIAAALLQKGTDTSPVQHWTQGAARLADAFAGVMKERRATKATEANASANSDMIARMLAGVSGSPVSPAPTTSAPSLAPAPVATNPNVGSTIDFARAEKATDLKSGIVSTAQALGIDPVDLATVISYETAGTFDPKKAGPTTQWGQHRGLIQFGEPQAKQYGVDWNDPIGSQLGPEGAIVKYLLGSGFKPGMSGLDLYSTINAGAPGRYSASDANNGGAPGDVRDKWENQMHNHRAKAMALLGGDFAPPASRDAAPVQVAQAAPVTASDASGLNPVILEAMSSPYADEQTKRIAGLLLGQHLDRQAQASDPMRALEMQKAQIEIDALRNPRPKYDFVTGRDGSIFRTDGRGNLEQVYGGKADPVTVGGNLVDPSTGQVIYSAPQDPTKIGEGETLVGPDGRVIYQGAPKAPDLPTEVREYQFYADQERAAGRQPLGFNDWSLQGKRAGASQVNIDQKAEGAFDKKLAEGQAEAFNAMASEGLNARSDLGVIGGLEALLQGQGGALTGLSGWLAQRGFGDLIGEGASDLQAAQALINKLVPTQRQPGSGSMSDRDVELFTRSLPNLWNTPEGNQKIIGAMRGLAEYKAAQGEIADQVLAGEMTRQEARRALRALPNPLADYSAAGNEPAPARRELARRELARREQARQAQGGGVLRTIDDAVRGMADVATFGFADEIAAKMGSFTGIGGMTGDYEGNIAAQRARDAEGGGARLAGQVIGALAVPGGAAKTTVGAAGQGAILGGLYGLGSGEGALADRAPDAGMGALVGGAAGAAVHKVADALLGRAAKKAVPSLDDLRATSQSGYDAAEAAGVIIKPEGVQRLATGLVGDLADFGYHPALQPRVKAVLEEAERLAQGNVTFKGLDQFRRIAKNAAASTDPSEAAIGSRIVRRIEAYMENLPADDVLTGNAAQAAAGVRQGRENWARMRRGEMVDTARLKAERRAATGGTGGNLDNTIRQNVRAILDNPKRSRGMTPAEIEAAEKVVRGTKTQNALRLAGRLSPTTGGLSAMLNVGATAANPLLAIPGVGGAVAKALADGMTVKNANALSEMIRTGGHTASQLGQRALQGVGPQELVRVAQAIKAGEARLSPAMAAIAAMLLERAQAQP